MNHHFPLHPLIVHFPIALFISALGIEVLSIIFKKESLHYTAACNYVLGVLASLAAILSAWWEGMSLKHAVFYNHKTLAYITFSFSFIGGLILFLIRKRAVYRLIFFTFLLASAILVGATAYYGGKMVYEYGVGVEE